MLPKAMLSKCWPGIGGINALREHTFHLKTCLILVNFKDMDKSFVQGLMNQRAHLAVELLRISRHYHEHVAGVELDFTAGSTHKFRSKISIDRHHCIGPNAKINQTTNLDPLLVLQLLTENSKEAACGAGPAGSCVQFRTRLRAHSQDPKL